MKNRGFIIALIILLIIIVISLIWFLIMFISGKQNFFMGFQKKSTNLVYDEIFELEEFKNIEITSDAGEITVEESENNSVRVVVYAQNEADVKVKISGNTLNVKNTTSKKNNFFNARAYINDIIVYVPENFSEEIKIKSNYGDCKVASFENASVNIDLDCGDIAVDEVKNANIKNSYGDIKINTILNKCNIDSSCGDVKIVELDLNEDSTIKIDLGDVKIEKTNDIYVDASVDLGDINIKDNNRHSDITLKIKSDCGDIHVGD